MMSRILLPAVALAALSLLVACGDNDVTVKGNFYDSTTEVFLENGKMHAATTQFTDAEMRQRLCDRAWRRAYAFYYDEWKVGKRSEIAFASDNYYVWNADGTARLGNVNNYREQVDYTYSTQGRVVTMTSPELTFTLRVAAIDDTLLVTDTPMTGQHITGYDDATVRQRTVFTKMAVPSPPL